MQKRRLKPWLWLPASWAHALSPLALRFLNHFGDGQPLVWKSKQWRQFIFKNPLGIAGGVDKNAEFLRAWWNLGAGFVEVGTVTPLPQEANEGPIISRDKKSKTLWNRMGFPSHGMEEVLFNLKFFGPNYATPVFVNVGKNRTTSLENAVDDYLAVMNHLHPVTDIFVVNISSPNTAGLRDLQKRENLQTFLQPLISFCKKQNDKPLLLKISPDLTEGELEEVLNTSVDCGVSGFVLTNTTLERSPESHFPKEGGLSGFPLKHRSEEVLKNTIKILGPRRKELLIVSVGGVFSTSDVLQRLALGADLVQTYSALVFEGPHFFKNVAAEINEWKN